MRRIAPLIGLLLVPLLACLEPGPTPLGPQASDLEPPDSIQFLSRCMVLLSAPAWEESIPLFEPETLFCGHDRNHTGFRAEPLWKFDLSAFADYEPYLLEAEFLVDLPPRTWQPADTVDVLDWDNPDLDRNIRVELMSFADWPDEDEPLLSLEGLDLRDVTGAGPVGPDTEGAPQFAIPLPLDSLRQWILDAVEGRDLHLAFRLDDSSDSGLLRLYGRHSLAPQDTVPPAARIRISYFIDEQKDAVQACSAEAQALSRSGGEGAVGIDLGTGIPRHCLLNLQLPEELRDPELMILRARLQLWPDLEHFTGVGGHDREAGGLTLRLLAPATELDPLEIPEDDYLALASALDLFPARNQAAEPLSLPLTPWVQNWITGVGENHGLLLTLNGRDERPRRLSFYADEPGREPTLEIYYARRPDFD